MTCPLLNVLNMLYKEEMWDTAVAYKGKKNDVFTENNY